MTATRAISKTGPITGQDHVTAVADSVNAFANYVAGNAISPSGTNAVEFTIDVMTGLTGIPDGFELDIILPNANTGAMTFEITGAGLGTKPVRKNDGTAFVGGEFVAGTAYKFKFWGGAYDHWRQVGSPRVSETGARYPLIYTEVITATGAWSFTAPWDCDICISVIGGGGGGRSGGGGTNRSGGGAGGHAKKFFSLSSGDVISGIVGEGGAANTAGGSSTATSSDVTLSITASGGNGGVTTGTAAGGTATGGDKNYTGGESSTGSGVANGGGAIGLNADGNSNSGITGGVSLSNTSPISVTPFVHGQISGGDGTNLSVAGTSGTFGCGGGGGNGGGAGGNGFIIIQYSADKSA